MATQWPPKKNTAFTFYFSLYKSDGTIIANPGTFTKKVSIDGGAMGNIAASVTEEDTTYGQMSVVLASGEMNGDAIWIYLIDDTSGCVPLTTTIYTAGSTQDELKADTAAIKTKTDFLPSATAGAAGGVFIAGTNAATTVTTALTTTFTGNLTGSVGSVTGAVGSVTGNVGGNVTGSVGSIASGGITAASFAADARLLLGIVAYGTAQSATGTTLVLASASTFANDEIIGAVAVITGGSTGVGQSRVITDYVGSTDTATVDTWTTTPTGTITYVVFAAAPASTTALPAVNVHQINDVTIIGDGDGTPFDVA